MLANVTSADELFQNAVRVIVNPLITLMFILALCVFVYGVFEFIRGADNEDARKKGQSHMIWGVIGLFIMVSVFAIIRLLLNTFGIDLPEGNLLK